VVWFLKTQKSRPFGSAAGQDLLRAPAAVSYACMDDVAAVRGARSALNVAIEDPLLRIY